MPNEFVVRNGIIALNNSVVSGSLIVTQGITGSLFGYISGSGTTSYVPRFGANQYIIDSQIFDNGTNIGIGTAAPSYKLHVAGTGYYSGILSLGADLNIANTKELQWRDSIGNSWNLLYMFSDNNVYLSAPSASSNLIFRRAGYAESMRITSAGNVGIGTTSPLTYAAANTTLEISGKSSGGAGGVYVSNNGKTVVSHLYSDGLVGGVGTQTNQPFIITTNNTERVRITDGGNVGIGTTSPTSYGGYTTLAINGTTAGLIDIMNNGTVRGQISAGASEMYLEAKGASAIRFITNNSEGMRLTSAGSVGIGTTSPSFKLDVNSGTGANSFRALSTNTSSNRVFLEATSGSVEQHFLYTGNQDWVLGLDKADSNKFKLASADDGFTSAKLTVTTAGSVGIGTTSPSVKLEIKDGNLAVSKSSGEVDVFLNIGGVSYFNFHSDTQYGLYSTDYGSLFIRNKSTGLLNIYDKVYVTSGGNVGIGTTAPNAAITVVGSSGDTTSNRDIAVFAENSGIFVDDAGTTNSRLGLVKKAGFAPAIAAGSTTILSLGHWSTVNLLGNIRTGSFTADLSIATNGNVGIGTSTPSYKLDVTGTGQFRSSTVNSGSTPAGIFLSGDDKDAIWRSGLKVQHSSDVAITAGSSIGISLDPLASTSSTFYGSAAIKAIRPNATANNQDTDLAIFTRAGASNSTTDTEKMRITSTGNVGIGTTAPIARLHVAGTSTYNSDTVKAFRVSDATTLTKAVDIGYDTALDKGFIQAAYFTSDWRALLIQPNGGNVGIGTISPDSKLHVAAGNIRIGASLDNTTYSIGKATTGGEVFRNAIRFVSTTTDDYLQFSTHKSGVSSDVRMTIDATGNVGIGVTNPNRTLTIGAGGILGLYDSSNSGQGTLQMSTSGLELYVGASKYIVLGTNSIERVRVDSSGNVAIGVTSADSTSLRIVPTSTDTVQRVLHIGYNGSMSTGTHGSIITFGNATPSTAQLARIGAFYEGSTFMGSLRFYTNSDTEGANPSERMRITQGGNVGIGTTTPTGSLHVAGTTTTLGAMQIVSTVSGGPSALTTFKPLNASSLNTNYEFQLNPAGGAYGSFIVKNVDTGVNQNLLQLSALNLSGDSFINVPSVLQNISLRVNNDPKLFISGSGNVGIGTTSPNTRLSVIGNVDLRNTAAGLGSNYGVELSTNSNTPRVSLVDNGVYSGEFFSSATIAGLKNISNNPLTFGTNNTERARFTADGNLLIGTTVDVSNKLVVRGTSRIANSDGASMLYVTHGASTGNTYTELDALVGSGGGWGNLVFQSGGGNVGIGTTSPSQKLDVSGSIQAKSASPLFIAYASNASYFGGLSIQENGTERARYAANTVNGAYIYSIQGNGFSFLNSSGGTVFRQTDAGLVGLGTTSPSTALHIARTATDGATIRLQTTNSTANGSIQWANSANSIIALIGSNYNVSDSAGGLEFIAGGTTTRMFISSSGNVGIGTSTPTYGVVINNASTLNTGTAFINASLNSSGKGLVINSNTRTTADNSVLAFEIINRAGNNTIAATVEGNVGIGTTSPGAKLQVQGNTVISGSLILTGSFSMQSGSIDIKPYTSGGVILTGDASEWSNSANYTHPQIRLRDYRTGITFVNNTEVHIVSNTKAIAAAKTVSAIPRFILASDTQLQWSSAETNGFTLDTGIRRLSAGVLEVTSSIVAQSFTGSLQGTASFAVSASWAPGGGGSAPTAVTFNRVTGNYTFALTDAGKTVEVSASAAGTYNLTVPPASTTNFADGTFIDVILYGTGSIQFVTGSGVTFRSANNWTKLGTRYGAATLINIAGDEWYLIGNLNA